MLIKNKILNVLRVIAFCGTFRVVGPITIAYNEPNIIPIIAYTIAERCLSNSFLIILSTVATPNKIPSPSANKSGKLLRSK